MSTSSQDRIRNAVRDRYGEIARSEAGCCVSSSCCSTPAGAEASPQLGYSSEDMAAVPEGSNMGLGCGNPRAIAALKEGETVLDLGSGGGFDCFLAARQVGPAGRVIGVDMTPEMITKARAAAEQGGHENVEFRLGEIEHVPAADNSVNVIMSNCVINLSPDKRQVFREAHRILRPGERLAIADVVATREIPETVKQDLNKHAGCVSGAAIVDDLRAMLRDAGFTRITVATKEESREFIKNWFPGS